MTYPPSPSASSGEVAARMFTPGAAISGCPTEKSQEDDIRRIYMVNPEAKLEHRHGLLSKFEEGTSKC